MNATGVVLHTGLGRAPFGPEVVDALARELSGYCVVSVDRQEGQRIRREAAAARMLCALTGAEVSGRAVFENGQYRVVIKRSLAAKDAERTTFRPAEFTPIAFQAWDGGAGETGARMSLTSWYYLRLEESRSNARFVVPPVVALLALGGMLLIVWAANRRGRPA